MNLDELHYILKQGEGTTIEYKESIDSVPRTLYDTVVSFSNTDGGTVVLGADDQGNVLGINSELVTQFINQIISTLNDGSQFTPCLFLTPVSVAHEDGTVVVLKVPASSDLHKFSGKVYWRSGDNDQDVTRNNKKIEEIIFQKKEVFSEGNIYPFLTFDDLDNTLFDKARKIIASRDSNHPWLEMDNKELLSSACLFRKDFKSGEEGLTLAAALIFGKDQTIHSLLPGYKVDALVRVDDLDRHDDRLLLRTNLIDTYIDLLSFVKSHLPDKFYQEDGQRKDLRQLIFREVIGNLIVHREYTNAHSSELIIYKHKVSVANPNKPIFHGPLDIDQFNPYPKNPNIRKFFTAFGWTDELGSGVRNTSKFLNMYVPGAKPSFIENTTFLTEVPLKVANLKGFAAEIASLLNLSEEGTALLTANLNVLTIDPSLEFTNFEDLILHLVPSWNQKGTKLEQLKWPKKQVFTKEEAEKVLSRASKGTELVHKKVAYFVKILFLSVKPISMTEMMALIGYSNRNTFRTNYLMPLQSVDLIKRTLEDPNAPDQKYQTTESGKRFLTGSEV